MKPRLPLLKGISMLIALITWLPIIPQAMAQVVITRSQLLSLPNTLTETFETLNIPERDAAFEGSQHILNSATKFYGQGPGLVLPGIEFVSSAGIQWNGRRYSGNQSQNLHAYNATGFTLRFLSQPTAIGFDISSLYAFSANVTITALSVDGLFLKSSSVSFSPFGAPLFWGLQDSRGIGRVMVTSDLLAWSPAIDNVTYSVVPEPSLHALLAVSSVTALIYRRRGRETTKQKASDGSRA